MNRERSQVPAPNRICRGDRPVRALGWSSSCVQATSQLSCQVFHRARVFDCIWLVLPVNDKDIAKAMILMYLFHQLLPSFCALHLGIFDLFFSCYVGRVDSPSSLNIDNRHSTALESMHADTAMLDTCKMNLNLYVCATGNEDRSIPFVTQARPLDVNGPIREA